MTAPAHEQEQKHEWFCCEDCDHDEQGSCPVPEKVIKNISDLKKFQTIVKVTGCKHQKGSRPHTSTPTTCPQNAIWDHCPHVTAIRKAEREKVLSFLDELISDRVSDARKREIIESLRREP